MKKSAVVAKATSADFSMIRFYYIIVFITIIPSKNVPVLRLFHRKTFQYYDYSIEKRK